jgi:hypothetical protein
VTIKKFTHIQPAYGEVWAHGVADVITSVAQNDYDQIVGFNTNGANHRTTPDHTNDHIVILVPGVYQIHFEWSGYGPAVAHDWNFHIYKNNGATAFNNITAHQTTPSTQKTESIGCTGLASLAVNDTVEMWVQRTSAGNNINLTTVHCTISAHLIH